MALIDEIREQPEVVAHLLTAAVPDVATVVAAAKAKDPSHVLIAARGTSDHAAIYAQYAMPCSPDRRSGSRRRACCRSTGRDPTCSGRS